MVPRVAILGSGNIGCDLLIKVMRSPYLRCHYFIGRNQQSAGLEYASKLGVRCHHHGIDELLEHLNEVDVVFDASSAQAHLQHAQVLEGQGKLLINLTPADTGTWCVPTINSNTLGDVENLNMITCGGQASLPIVHAIRRTGQNLTYVEAVSSISARSAGAATRLNVNEYLCTTERALKHFSGAPNVKSILNINPADPPVDMQTTIFALMDNPDIDGLRRSARSMVEQVREYMPGYSMIMEPSLIDGKVMAMVRATGAGDYLPAYAGNLDIITSAAVRAAEDRCRN
ncbi:acetylating acetaldehyde dehydrogenase [Azotobacter armeniacus]